MSRTIQVTFDAHDPQALSRFWAEAMGYINPPPPGRELWASGALSTIRTLRRPNA